MAQKEPCCQKECWKTEKPHLKKTEITGAVGCVRMWKEGRKAEMERRNEEAKQEESRSLKKEVDREEERVQKDELVPKRHVYSQRSNELLDPQ